MMSRISLFLLLVVAVLVSEVQAGSPVFGDGYYNLPSLSHRGRAVERNGLFHFRRVRWGNGVTNNGVQAIGQIPAIIGSISGLLTVEDEDGADTLADQDTCLDLAQIRANNADIETLNQAVRTMLEGTTPGELPGG